MCFWISSSDSAGSNAAMPNPQPVGGPVEGFMWPSLGFAVVKAS